MNFLRKIFQKKQSAQSSEPEHAVIVHFDYGTTDLQPVFDLEDRLESVIDTASVGEFDGNEMAVDGSDGYLYMYGPDGDELFEAVQPILENTPFMSGARVLVRYGPPEDGVRDRIVTIDA